MLPRIAVLTLAALVLLNFGAWADWEDPPIILHVFPDADELVIQGMNLSLDGPFEPTVVLGDGLLIIVSFSPTEIRALLPTPPLDPGTYLLTVDKGNPKFKRLVGACDVTVSAADLSCVGCVSEPELDFDPATQVELTDHAALPDVHHTPPTELPPSGAAGGDLTGSYPDPTLRDNAVTGTKVESTQVQLRVAGTCPPGTSIRAVSATGAVTCEEDTDTRLSPVVSGWWHASRIGTAGCTYKYLGDYNGRRICFLTMVEVEETDSTNESAGCEVSVVGPQPLRWRLAACLGRSSDTEVGCRARCLSW